MGAGGIGGVGRSASSRHRGRTARSTTAARVGSHKVCSQQPLPQPCATALLAAAIVTEDVEQAAAMAALLAAAAIAASVVTVVAATARLAGSRRSHNPDHKPHQPHRSARSSRCRHCSNRCRVPGRSNHGTRRRTTVRSSHCHSHCRSSRDDGGGTGLSRHRTSRGCGRCGRPSGGNHTSRRPCSSDGDDGHGHIRSRCHNRCCNRCRSRSLARSRNRYHKQPRPHIRGHSPCHNTKEPLLRSMTVPSHNSWLATAVAAVAIQAHHAVQELKSEALSAEAYADYQRAEKQVPFHRATSPCNEVEPPVCVTSTRDRHDRRRWRRKRAPAA